MPVALSGIIAAVVGTGAIGAALQTGLALFTMAAGTALGGAVLSFGLSYLASSLFRPSQPKPEDVQQSVRHPAAPRIRHYGRVKTSGSWVFADAEHGIFHKVLAIGQGPIDAIEEYWLDDNLVTIRPNGYVNTSPWGDYNDVRILTRSGNPSETYYSELGAIFPEWTEDYRGSGVASLYAMQDAVLDEDYLRYFPNGINTNYRLVIRAALVKNPVTNAIAWSDNAASIIRDYMSHADGMRLPESLFTTPLASAGWIAAYNLANEAVPVNSGGSETRYRLWGSYRLDERPADVLGRMIACCDGRIVPTPDGGLTLDIGAWKEPSIIIDGDAIVGFSDLSRGRDIMSTANTVRATFFDPSQDYQAADADPWADESDVSERGEIPKDIQLNMAPSHSQARRLMKLEWFRANPNWVGTFTCNLRGLAAFGERFIRIRYPLFNIDSVFELQDFRFVLGEGGIVQGVSLQVQSMPSSAYQWDTSQEGQAPVSNKTDIDDQLPVPTAPVVYIDDDLVAHMSFPPSPSNILSYMVRWKTVANTEWIKAGPLPNEASSFKIPNLNAADTYQFQLAMRTEKGRLGQWSDTTEQTAP